LDRSGSMCLPSGSPCSGTDNSKPCGKMIDAAKQFTGQFAENRDYIGLVSFDENIYIHQTPTQTFQTALGFTNNSGSATGDLDDISCDGNTNTAQAIAAGYQMLYQMQLPGALNILLLETDGMPNTLSLNFWDSGHTVAGIASGSSCTDSNSKTKAGGGFATAASLPTWSYGLTLNSAPFLTAAGPYSNIPSGIIG